MEKCYFMFKPGYTDDVTVKKVLNKLKDEGFSVVKTKKMKLSSEACREHYAHIVDLKDKITGEPIYPKLESYMLSDVVVGCLIEGNDGTIDKLRKIMGSTKNPEKGTLREIYTKRVPLEDRVTKNGFHCSDSVENGEIEIDRFFNRAKELKIEEVNSIEK